MEELTGCRKPAGALGFVAFSGWDCEGKSIKGRLPILAGRTRILGYIANHSRTRIAARTCFTNNRGYRGERKDSEAHASAMLQMQEL